MYNTSQSDFFDEHLSALLRDIVETDADILGESKRLRHVAESKERHRRGIFYEIAGAPFRKMVYQNLEPALAVLHW